MTLGDFTSQAEAYARARPTYPEELLEEVLDLAEVSEGAPVCDLGAGTGILARQLARRSLRVTALEPNLLMQALADECPGITWREGTFEVSGLASEAFELAVAGQSLHWADLPRALPEIHRILRPGGHLCALWNVRQAECHPILAFTYAAIRSRLPSFDELYTGRDWASLLVSTGHFAEPIERSTRRIVPMSRERYLDLWRSHNLLNHLAGSELLDDLLAEIAERLERGGWNEVAVPYQATAWLVRRD